MLVSPVAVSGVASRVEVLGGCRPQGRPRPVLAGLRKAVGSRETPPQSRLAWSDLTFWQGLMDATDRREALG